MEVNRSPVAIGRLPAALNLPHHVGAVRKHWVFEKERIELLEPPSECDRLGRVHLPVNLDANVDGRAHGLADSAHSLDRIVRPFGVGAIEPEFGPERSKSNCRESRIDLRHRVSGQILSGVSVHVHVATHLVARQTAHQFVDRHAEPLAFYVPTTRCLWQKALPARPSP